MKRTFSKLAFSGLVVFGLAAAASSAHASALAASGSAVNAAKIVDRSMEENIVEANHHRKHRNHRRWHRHRNWDNDRPRTGFYFEFGTGVPRYGPSYVRPRYVQPRYVLPRAARGLPSAHVNWCYARYRSYRAYDNTFQPYNGPRRACISPYWR